METFKAIAVHIQQRNNAFYLTKLRVKDLVRISYVAQRGVSNEEGAVQRILNRVRIAGVREFAEAGGDAMAADRSMKAIFLPAGTGEMAAGDTFDGEDFAAAGAGEAALEFGQVDAGGEIVAEDVVGADVFGEAKPMPGERGEDFALVGDRRGHDDVVSGDAIRGDQPDFVAPGIDVAHFAAA